MNTICTFPENKSSTCTAFKLKVMSYALIERNSGASVFRKNVGVKVQDTIFYGSLIDCLNV